MKRLSGAVSIDQGAVVLFNEVQDGGAMWQGEGPREVRVAQKFSEPFIDEPSVMVGMAMWDIAHQTNARMDLSAENIGPDGFDIVFRTWSDTHVARVRASWMAIGISWDEAGQ
jgi:hypothetical protein